MSDRSVVVFHNARCSKSRAACELVAGHGISATIVNYLENPPTAETLRDLLAKLGMRPGELVRRGEDVFKTHYAGRELSDEEWLTALVAHPDLIERPIVVVGDKAVIGRPTERVKALLDAAP